MKRAIPFLALLALGLSAQAEPTKINRSADSQQFSRGGSGSQGYSEIKPTKELPKPRPGGIIYEISDKGFQVINPLAPKGLDVTASTWAATPIAADLCQNKEDEARRTGGGFKFWSWEW